MKSSERKILCKKPQHTPVFRVSQNNTFISIYQAKNWQPKRITSLKTETQEASSTLLESKRDPPFE